PVIAGAAQVAQPGGADGIDARIIAGWLVAVVLLRCRQRFAATLGEDDLPVRARPCQSKRQGDAGGAGTQDAYVTVLQRQARMVQQVDNHLVTVLRLQATSRDTWIGRKSRHQCRFCWMNVPGRTLTARAPAADNPTSHAS